VEVRGVISIWFFIGISLAVNGALILSAGIYQLVNPPLHPGVVLFNLHAGVWWGAVLLVLGLVYCFKLAPTRRS
jgi:protein-S-isoprenylcysteine O-methyltransferase Ste14